MKGNMHVVGSIGLELSKAPPELKNVEVKAWLDDSLESGRSVVYIATGTLVPLSPRQVGTFLEDPCGALSLDMLLCSRAMMMALAETSVRRDSPPCQSCSPS